MNIQAINKFAKIEIFFRYQDIELESISRKVTRAGSRLKLSTGEYRLLLHFMENPGEIYTLDNIYDVIRKPDSPKTLGDNHLVTTAIYRLRLSLGHPDVINYYKGTGYGFGNLLPGAQIIRDHVRRPRWRLDNATHERHMRLIG